MNEPIAIVGIGCRLPGGADGPDSLWSLLGQGFDAITPIPPERFDLDALYDERPATPGRIMSRWGGFLTDVEDFDADFFEIAPREAERLDPQQRLLLETTWEALEDAGLTRDRMAGSDTGVFVGMWLNDFEAHLYSDPAALDLYMTTGSGRYAAAGRLSFFLDLRGPSVSIDTACSSSLVAVHLACQSLRSGECEMALAGGANVLLQPHITIAYSQSRMMAPDGHCKFGDAAADGYVRSDGAAMVALKRLSTALADEDDIYAVVLGSAVTNDGRSSGFLATPGRGGQEEMLRRAYADAGIDPRTVQYVEAHGTGTAAGDPVEVGALGAVVGAGRPAISPCLIGSLKTNVGHTEGAAGVAGLIKVALALKHGEIPPSIHFHTPNPDMDWDDLGLAVAAEAQAWPDVDGPARGGVSSFGIAGTNAHVVLEAFTPPDPQVPLRAGRSPWLLPISARSSAALDDLVAAYHGLLAQDAAPALEDVCAGAALGRTHHDVRLAVLTDGVEDAQSKLRTRTEGVSSPGVFEGRSNTLPRVAFVFPGQGSQWTGMARELLATEPVFRASMERCDDAIREEAGWSVLAQLGDDDGSSASDQIDVVQPTLFAVQVALAAQWQAWGVEPDAVVGHSMGEVAAAHVAGALDLRDAVAVICRRSNLLRRIAGNGAMAVVELTTDEAEVAISGHEHQVSVAVSNGPRSTVISGDGTAIDAVLADLEAAGVFCRRVKVDVASHSPQVDPLLEELRNALEGLAPAPSRIPIYSTVDSAVIDGRSFDADYWARNLRQPVLFGAAVALMAGDEHTAFVEIGPHPLLVPAIDEMLRHAARDGIAVPSLRRAEPERATMLAGLAALYVHGCNVDWSAITPTGSRHVRLPTYPWQRERFWYEPAAPAPQGSHPLLGQCHRPASAPGTTCWETTLGRSDMSYLNDHVVRGAPVFPTTGFIEFALAAADAHRPGVHEITELVLTEALPIDGEATIQLVTDDGSVDRRFRCFSSDATGGWRLHAEGRTQEVSSVASRTVSIEAIRSRCTDHWSRTDHATTMRSHGLDYGPAFQAVEEGWSGDAETLGRIRRPDGVRGRIAERICLLDGCLQLAVTALPDTAVGEVVVPVGADHVRIVDRVEDDEERWGHVVVVQSSHDDFVVDVTMLGQDGTVLAEVRGLRMRRSARDAAAELDGLFYELNWESGAPPTAPGPTPLGSWLVFGAPGVASDLVTRLRLHGARCVTVKAADEYERIGSEEYAVDPTSNEDHRRLLRDALDDANPPLRGVVYAWAATVDGDDPSTLADAEQLGCTAAVALVQALGARDREGDGDRTESPRLWLVTRGAQSPDGSPVNALQAVVWGLGRVIATERPELRCTLVDLDPADGPADDHVLFAEITADDDERQVAHRGHERMVARLGRRRPTDSGEPATVETGAYRLVTATPGTTDGLRLRSVRRRRPGPREVEIQVGASGLNFLDVLKAMGVYPGVEPGPQVAIGAECAGTIVSIGSDVAEFAVGDQVVALTPSYSDTGMLAAFVTLPEAFVAPRPAHLSETAAAALPVAMVTAYYALHALGRIRRGERVLVHAASGGVGLAAVQMCRRAGAEVFATAGSPDKREYLRSIGLEHVFDSRGVEFADEVRRATDGRGVDLVLNSLAGDAIPAGLTAMAPGGRFVEIGKRDVYADTQIGLGSFKRNVSLFVVDLADLTETDPDLVARHFRDVIRLVSTRDLDALPTSVLPITEASTAFHTMAQTRHVGKLVLEHPGTPVRADAPLVDPDATHLITGGLGALGLAVARHLVDRGARYLALLGRTEPSPDAAAAIAALEGLGAHVVPVTADVSDPQQLAAALALVAEQLPPLRGVVHAAGVLADATLAELDESAIRAVLAPKLSGAWNLHTLTKDEPLDFFVLFSSVSALLGLPGQANYAAGNAFLDALAHQRRRAGLAALSIGWGPWADVGLAAARSDRGKRLAGRGLGAVAPAEALAALDVLLAGESPHVAVVRIDPDRWTAAEPSAMPLLSMLTATEEDGRPGQVGPALRERLMAVPAGARRRRALEDLVCATVGVVLRLAPERIDRNRPVKAMGLDSLMALELRNRLERETALNLSATIAFNYPTVTSLTDHLAHRMDVSLEAAEAVSSPGPDRSDPESELVEVPQDDLEAVLADELAAVDKLLRAD